MSILFLHNKYIKDEILCTRNVTAVNSCLHRKCAHCRAGLSKVKFQGTCFRKIKVKRYKYFPGRQYFRIHCGDVRKLLILTLCNRKRRTYFVRNQKHSVPRSANKRAEPRKDWKVISVKCKSWELEHQSAHIINLELRKVAKICQFNFTIEKTCGGKLLKWLLLLFQICVNLSPYVTINWILLKSAVQQFEGPYFAEYEITAPQLGKFKPVYRRTNC